MRIQKFTEFTQPPLTVMIRQSHPDAILRDVLKTKEQGAEAYCLLINELDEPYRTRSVYREIFDAMGDCPAYIANYPWGKNADKSDEYCLSQAAEALECGAVLMDIPGDSFCRSENEITYDEHAVQKQMQWIRQIHAAEKEVIMSSHTRKFLVLEDVFRIAEAQKERGADIAKIVTNADTPAELAENLKISACLKQNFPHPHLFICNGRECKTHRLLSSVLGSCFTLCLADSDATKSQPSLEKMKNFRDHFRDMDKYF